MTGDAWHMSVVLDREKGDFRSRIHRINPSMGWHGSYGAKLREFGSPDEKVGLSCWHARVGGS